MRKRTLFSDEQGRDIAPLGKKIGHVGSLVPNLLVNDNEGIDFIN